MSDTIKVPTIVSTAAQEAFAAQARRMGLDPDDPWIGGYVDYEWQHLRHVVDALPHRLDDMHVLEFGCNVGATAILLSASGAKVTAIDISPDWVELARLNAKRYGFDDIEFICVHDTRQLPFSDAQFQMVSCISVLEYVTPTELLDVQRQIDRVLAPGGTILVSGTSNRLSPREVHSGRWLSNYLPRSMDRMLGRQFQRGVWPWAARFGFGRGYDNIDHAGHHGLFASSRRAMGMPSARLTVLRTLARILGVGPGLISPNLFCLLRKRA